MPKTKIPPQNKELCPIGDIPIKHEMNHFSREENVTRQLLSITLNYFRPSFHLSASIEWNFSASVFLFCVFLKSLKWNLVKFCDFVTSRLSQLFAKSKKQGLCVSEIFNEHMQTHVSCSCKCLFDLLALIPNETSLWHWNALYWNIWSERNILKKITMRIFKKTFMTDNSHKLIGITLNGLK